jgi:hypothetical protein
LQILLGSLLALKALFIIMRLVGLGENDGGLEVVFGLAHPRARGPFHRELCPWL